MGGGSLLYWDGVQTLSESQRRRERTSEDGMGEAAVKICDDGVATTGSESCDATGLSRTTFSYSHLFLGIVAYEVLKSLSFLYSGTD